MVSIDPLYKESLDSRSRNAAVVNKQLTPSLTNQTGTGPISQQNQLVSQHAKPNQTSQLGQVAQQEHVRENNRERVGGQTIECEIWRRHSSLIFLMLVFTKPNIKVSGWLLGWFVRPTKKCITQKSLS